MCVRTKRPAVNDGEVEVRVEAIGLNFRDVLNAAKLHMMHRSSGQRPSTRRSMDFRWQNPKP